MRSARPSPNLNETLTEPKRGAGLVRRHAYLIQTGRARWIVRVSAAGRTPTEIERDIEAIAGWARDRGHVAHVVAGARELDL